jgi:hypothetical protein
LCKWRKTSMQCSVPLQWQSIMTTTAAVAAAEPREPTTPLHPASLDLLSVAFSAASVCEVVGFGCSFEAVLGIQTALHGSVGASAKITSLMPTHALNNSCHRAGSRW